MMKFVCLAALATVALASEDRYGYADARPYGAPAAYGYGAPAAHAGYGYGASAGSAAPAAYGYEAASFPASRDHYDYAAASPVATHYQGANDAYVGYGTNSYAAPARGRATHGYAANYGNVAATSELRHFSNSEAAHDQGKAGFCSPEDNYRGGNQNGKCCNSQYWPMDTYAQTQNKCCGRNYYNPNSQYCDGETLVKQRTVVENKRIIPGGRDVNTKVYQTAHGSVAQKTYIQREPAIQTSVTVRDSVQGTKHAQLAYAQGYESISEPHITAASPWARAYPAGKAPGDFDGAFRGSVEAGNSIITHALNTRDHTNDYVPTTDRVDVGVGYNNGYGSAPYNGPYNGNYNGNYGYNGNKGRDWYG